MSYKHLNLSSNVVNRSTLNWIRPVQYTLNCITIFILLNRVACSKEQVYHNNDTIFRPSHKRYYHCFTDEVVFWYSSITQISEKTTTILLFHRFYERQWSQFKKLLRIRIEYQSTFNMVEINVDIWETLFHYFSIFQGSDWLL